MNNCFFPKVSTIENGKFQYHKNSQNESTKYYRCSKSCSYKCLTRVIIDGQQTTEKGTQLSKKSHNFKENRNTHTHSRTIY
ncbi:hypothetical protein HZS_1104 [Henneguya salminicola]|nr:hypothetical protein HZS_1104 [Henneguya salminicola]